MKRLLTVIMFAFVSISSYSYQVSTVISDPDPIPIPIIITQSTEGDDHQRSNPIIVYHIEGQFVFNFERNLGLVEIEITNIITSQSWSANVGSTVLTTIINTGETAGYYLIDIQIGSGTRYQGAIAI